MWQRGGKLPRRMTLLLAGLGAALAGIQLRLLQIQVLLAPELKDRARAQQERVIRLDPKRASIFDRNGRELAVSVDVDSVYADPSEIANLNLTARRLGAALSVRPEEIRNRIRRGSKRFAWVERKINPSQRRAVERLGLKGIYFTRESKRFYPKGRMAAHLLGYAGVDNQGLDGLEYSLDREVQGKPGFVVALRDARGEHPVVTEHAPTAGRAVILSIDEVIQHLAERELESTVNEHQARGGTAIVMRPETGEILALANRPTFDPNDYGDASPEALRNRSIGTIYEPGSTFKIVAAGAALEEKKVTPATVIDCLHGSIRIGKFTIREDRLPFDYLSVTEIVQKSSNVGAIKLAAMMPGSVFYRHITEFGFGRETGIDLPGESAGLLRPPAQWSGLSQASLAIGQEIGVTPLQSLQAMAAVANGGVLRRPWVVAGLVGEDGSVSRPAHSADPGRRILSESTAAALTGMLEEVVIEGTGKAAAVPGYTVAGKTGTAQKIDDSGRYARGRYVASFAGFVPSRDPALAIIVVVDEPHGGFHGGEISAPAFARIALPALQYLGVLPEDGGVVLDRRMEIQASLKSFESGPIVPRRLFASSRPTPSARPARFEPLAPPSIRRTDLPDPGEIEEMPDLSGRSLREATLLLAHMGLVVKVDGDGPRVGSQDPPPGADIRPGALCRLQLTEEKP